jgi:hypothetical protein
VCRSVGRCTSRQHGHAHASSAKVVAVTAAVKAVLVLVDGRQRRPSTCRELRNDHPLSSQDSCAGGVGVYPLWR